MNKITSLQILMLMSLALGSSQLYSDATDQTSDVAQLALQAQQNRRATIESLQENSANSPEVIGNIFIDTANLKASFQRIKNFVDQKNKDLKKLNAQNIVDQKKLELLASKLAHAQASLEQAIALQRAQYKNKNAYEQSIQDALMKAEQSVELLRKKFTKHDSSMTNNVVINAKKASKKNPKKLRIGKNTTDAITDIGESMVDATSELLERSPQSTSLIPSELEEEVLI